MCLTYYLLTRCGFMPQNRSRLQNYCFNSPILNFFNALQAGSSIYTLQKVHLEGILLLHSTSSLLLLSSQWVLWTLRLQCLLLPWVHHCTVKHELPHDSLLRSRRGHCCITEERPTAWLFQRNHANELLHVICLNLISFWFVLILPKLRIVLNQVMHYNCKVYLLISIQINQYFLGQLSKFFSFSNLCHFFPFIEERIKFWYTPERN